MRRLLAKEQPWVLAGPVEGPEPITEYDHVFEMDVECYVGRAGLDIPVRDPGGSTGVPLQVRARYQMCNGERCLRPRTVRLELAIADRDPAPSR
jgi:Thiol:disulfide interchange protein DsbD, N-terminal